MKKLIADMHMHTLVSGHAYGTIREMAATAGEKNLKLIGITEHAPGIPGTVDPFWNRNILIFWIMQSSESTKSVILMKEKKRTPTT